MAMVLSIPDDLGHHEVVEALVLEILSEGPFDDILHYCGCIINVVHLFYSQPIELE